MAGEWVRILGWLVIAHGVLHAVLPLRGSFAPAILIDDWVPVWLYAVAMFGFVGSGLGLLGIPPLHRAISPLLVLASGLSLVAIVRFADPTLSPGGVLDVVLLAIALWRAPGGWPVQATGLSRWQVSGVVVTVALLLGSATSMLLSSHGPWGRTRAEVQMAQPADPPLDAPAVVVQRH